jgi:hypothetical protein
MNAGGHIKANFGSLPFRYKFDNKDGSSTEAAEGKVASIRANPRASHLMSGFDGEDENSIHEEDETVKLAQERDPVLILEEDMEGEGAR